MSGAGEQDAVASYRKQVVTKRYTEGASAGQIAKELGVTRNVVSGIINRLKLPKRSEETNRQNGKTSRIKQHRPRGFAMPMIAGLGMSVAKDKKPPVFMGKDGHPEPLGPIADFPSDRTTCRYIHGEPSSGDWRCCAHPGFPWCEVHAKRFAAPATNKSNVDPKMLRNSGADRMFR